MTKPHRKPPTVTKRLLILGAKLLVIAVVVLFVGQAARDAWREISEEGISIDPAIAIFSGLAYLLGQAPMAWYWRKTLIALGQPAPFWPSIIAFYISQIGKYVPGKGMVVLIRTERMLHWGGRGRTIAASVFVETLTVMAVGAVLSALLLAFFSPQGETIWNAPWMPLVASCVGLGFLAPTIPPVARWIICRIAPPGGENDRAMLEEGLTFGLAAQGWVASMLAWTGFGASIWLAAWSVGASDLSGWSHTPLWILAAALPVVSGFLTFLPGGLLVREALSLSLLAPLLGEGKALAATLATRVIWVAAESLVCAILSIVYRRPHGRHHDDPNHPPH